MAELVDALPPTSPPGPPKPQAPQGPAVALSAAIPDRYVGEFEYAALGTIVTFRRDGATLFVKVGHPSGGPPCGALGDALRGPLGSHHRVPARRPGKGDRCHCGAGPVSHPAGAEVGQRSAPEPHNHRVSICRTGPGRYRSGHASKRRRESRPPSCSQSARNEGRGLADPSPRAKARFSPVGADRRGVPPIAPAQGVMRFDQLGSRPSTTRRRGPTIADCEACRGRSLPASSSG